MFFIILFRIVEIYSYIMFIYVLLSWTPLVSSRFYDYLRRICEPYLGIFRNKLIIGNMDFGALIGLLLLSGMVYYLGSLI
ncbi:MAG TPA: YggT family protein [Bacillota bacterium]|nr:YggT family protein [Bacillota bacterium]